MSKDNQVFVMVDFPMGFWKQKEAGTPIASEKQEAQTDLENRLTNEASTPTKTE